MKKILIMLLLLATSVFAEAEDKWKISLGGMYVTSFETEIQLGRSGSPVAAKLNTNEQLGMDYETNVFRLDGYYRFTDNHSVDFTYFSVRSDGGRTINASIPNWGENNDTIDAGATVSSYFNMDVYKINYVYSFYHNEDVELALSAGLHITSIDLGLSAQGSINGVPGEKLATSSSLTIPLPVIGFRGEYTVIDKTLFVQYKADYFYLSFDDFKGSLISSTINIEYRFLENYGAGLGFNSNNLSLTADDGNTRVDVTNDLSGLMFYVSYIY